MWLYLKRYWFWQNKLSHLGDNSESKRKSDVLEWVTKNAAEENKTWKEPKSTAQYTNCYNLDTIFQYFISGLFLRVVIRLKDTEN